ncbi:MAG: hypothetical protein WC372_09070 [Candidatus Neomarinimicrobiota bacterium]|nr:hypothetical protein [Candidatus Neomarinimicrobiota bacterium]MDD3966579.1 hypothetical protein [Candidatus Neomarinimicrobiota bacterium]MDX9779681.1 hypothetical protein [bacterium]
MRSRHEKYWLVLLIVLLAPLLGRQESDSERYRRAYELERKADYPAAEQLYRDLYEKQPQNYNYYTRYKYVLNRQRKFTALIPLLEQYSTRRAYDLYVRVELGVVYYAAGRREDALRTWDAVFRDKSPALQKNYAVYVYQNMSEYGLNVLLNPVIDDLRRLTGVPELLTRYAFINHLNFRNADKAAEELRLLIEKQPEELRNVQTALFALDPGEPVFRSIPAALQGLESDETSRFLSEFHLYLNDADAAVEVLSRDTGNVVLQRVLSELAVRLHRSGEYPAALRASDHLARYADKNLAAAMALLAARAQMDAFFATEIRTSRIPPPYPSRLNDVPFPAYQSEYAPLAEDARRRLEALRHAGPPVGPEARFYHAELLFRVYHDIDTALEEFLALAAEGYEKQKNGILARIADCYQARGEFSRARDFLEKAGSEYRLMVHEEDRLAPYLLRADFLAGSADSVYAHAMQVLALLPENDALYNEVLSFAAFVSQAGRDTLYRDAWLEAERLRVRNKISEAEAVYGRLLAAQSPGMPLYAMRRLECLNMLGKTEAESAFWAEYGNTLRNGASADYFTLRYAEYLEKMQNYEKAVEIYEEYLLSYRESMYYEMIRQYMRERNTPGAP